ncbi:hypothetical protein PM082_023306 [Marasmius tenuissimus]|nr:hypothetical protein PM082_023306 [Marasmius tenuissimus]
MQEELGSWLDPPTGWTPASLLDSLTCDVHFEDIYGYETGGALPNPQSVAGLPASASFAKPYEAPIIPSNAIASTSWVWDLSHHTFPLTVHLMSVPLNGVPGLETHSLVPLPGGTVQARYRNDGTVSVLACPLHSVLAGLMLSKNSGIRELMGMIKPEALSLHTFTSVPDSGPSLRSLHMHYRSAGGYRCLHNWNPLRWDKGVCPPELELRPLDPEHNLTRSFIVETERHVPEIFRDRHSAAHFFIVAEEVRPPTPTISPIVLPSIPALAFLDINSNVPSPSFFTSPTPSATPPSATASPSGTAGQYQYHYYCPENPPRSHLVLAEACMETNTPALLNISTMDLPRIFDRMNLDPCQYDSFSSIIQHKRTPTTAARSFDRAYEFLYRCGGPAPTEVKRIVYGPGFELTDGNVLTPSEMLRTCLKWEGVDARFLEREAALRWAERISQTAWKESLGQADLHYGVHCRIVAFFSWRRKGNLHAPNLGSGDPEEALAAELILNNIKKDHQAMSLKVETPDLRSPLRDLKPFD